MSPPAQAAHASDAGRRSRQDRDCHICGRQFSRAEHCARHVRSHTKDKPFVCPGCAKRYGRFDVLARHCRSSAHDSRCYQAFVSRPAGLSKRPVAADIANTRTTDAVAPDPTSATSWVEGGAQDITGSLPDSGIDDLSAVDAVDPANPLVQWSAVENFADIDLFRADDIFTPWNLNDVVHADLFNSPVFAISASPPDNPALPSIESLRREEVANLWYTRDKSVQAASDVPILVSASSSGVPSPADRGSSVDNRQRSRLESQLQIQPYEPSVPSIDFLNTCIRLFFAKTRSIIPVVHPATFRPTKRNAAVSLAMSAMGALFIGTDRALQIGIHLFRRLQKSTLLYWESTKTKSSDQLITQIQGAAICQAFAMLCGSSEVLSVADAFHGPPVAWSRQLGLLQLRNDITMDPEIGEAELQQMWHDWARREELIRMVLLLRIVDAELASLFHHEPLMSLKRNQAPPCCSQQLFMARNPQDWRCEYRKGYANSMPDARHGWRRATTSFSQVPKSASFTAYAALQDLHMQAVALHDDNSSIFDSRNNLNNSLTAFYNHFIRSNDEWPQSLKLNVLWHSIYISFLADLDLLERVIGRDGVQLPETDREQAIQWAQSSNALRAVIHALLIKEQMDASNVLEEPSIHVPRSLFTAGVVVYCFGKFNPQRTSTHRAWRENSWQELAEFRISHLLKEVTESVNDASLFTRPLHGIAQLLQRMGSWRLSRRFGDILGLLLVDELASVEA